MDTYLSRVPAMSAPEAEPSLRPRVLPPPSSDIKGHNWAEEDSDGENECGEFLYGVQGTCCADLYRHPQLDADIEAVKEIYGENAVSVREYGTIDDADIDLHINISFLDEEVATAWKVIRTEPIVLRLRFSLSQYLDGPEPTIDVFQPSNRDDFGLGIQLKKSPSFPGVQDSAVRSSLTGSDLRSGLAGTDLRGPRLMNRSVSCTLRNPKSELYGSHTTTQDRSVALLGLAKYKMLCWVRVSGVVQLERRGPISVLSGLVNPHLRTGTGRLNETFCGSPLRENAADWLPSFLTLCHCEERKAENRHFLVYM
ncbi:hypothetical protein AB205_0158870 [Aquarana catesbeiana]|uniref:Uncharacterized protein n=1 Tax=Aquarana catesbeiana TaxID=8400 RepID=A0A2G9S9Z6_AQUCT|nr:hypothetical protein AB205_0158870 [Aquarana catesbeiana]